MKIVRNAYFGILCSVLFSVSFTFTTVILKKVTHFDPVQQTFLGSVWMIVGSLPIVVYARKEVFGQPLHSYLTLLRAVLGSVALFLAVLASRYLPLAELAIIYSTMPGLSSIVARIFLKETCSMAQTISLLLAAVGALIAVRLPELLKDDSKSQSRFSAEYVIGLASAVAFVVSSAALNTLLRIIRDVHFSVQMVHLGLIAAVVSACVMATTGRELPSCGLEPLLIVSAGLTFFVGSCLKVLAVQSEAVAIVTVIRSCSDVVVALLFQVVFFQHFPDVYEWCGSATVIVSAGMIAWDKWKKHRPT